MDNLQVLKRLGHAEVKLFQKHMGLVPDGVIGPKTQMKLDWFKMQPGIHETKISMGFAPLRITQYHYAEERIHPVLEAKVPILGANGIQITEVRSGFFSNASLEGSGIILDGRAINVAGGYIPVTGKVSEQYAEVMFRYFRYADVQRAKGREPKPSKYFGIEIKDKAVAAVQCFKFRDDVNEKTPYGIGKNSIPYTPYKTLATDTGHPSWKNPDPRYKGKGGLIPAGTRVFILERNEWYTANDTGGGIYGAHVDEFVGVAALRKLHPQFPRAHMYVDLPDFRERFPVGYDYGLYDK